MLGFQLASAAHILQNSQGSRIAAEHGVVKAKGSWVTLDTPAQKPRVPTPSPSLPPPRSCCWSAWQENLHHSRIFFFLCEQTFLNAEPPVSIYIARKIHQNYQPLETIFWVDPKNLSTQKYVPSSSLGVSFPLLSLQSGNKNVNRRQYLGISAFHIPLRVHIKVLK